MDSDKTFGVYVRDDQWGIRESDRRDGVGVGASHLGAVVGKQHHAGGSVELVRRPLSQRVPGFQFGLHVGQAREYVRVRDLARSDAFTNPASVLGPADGHAHVAHPVGGFELEVTDRLHDRTVLGTASVPPGSGSRDRGPEDDRDVAGWIGSVEVLLRAQREVERADAPPGAEGDAEGSAVEPGVNEAHVEGSAAP